MVAVDRTHHAFADCDCLCEVMSVALDLNDGVEQTIYLLKGLVSFKDAVRQPYSFVPRE